MPAATLQAVTPWLVAHEEDRRFRWILAQTLAVSLVVGVITPQIRIPQADIGTVAELPPRHVRLLPEQPTLPSTQPPLPQESAVTTPQPEPAAERQKPVTEKVTPRQKAASSGVLALGDALRELRERTPKIVAEPGRNDTGAEAWEDPVQASLLSADVTRGSGGIKGGIAHESVLGTADLPLREAPGQVGGSLDGGESAAGPESAAAGSVVRSQEEIQELLDRNKGAMYTLYNRELLNNPSLQGTLVMGITIAPSGNVTRCVILSSELGSDSLEQQLAALVGGINFGNKPGGTVVTTRIPIEFFPR